MNASGTAEVLLNQGADVHAKSKYGNTPLHTAARADASAMAEVLLERGADVHAKNNDGAMPLHYGGVDGCFWDGSRCC